MTAWPRIACVGGWGSSAALWQPLARALPKAALEPVPWWECLEPGGGPLGRLLAAAEPPALFLGWSLGAVALLRAALDAPAGRASPPLCLLSGTARMTAAGDFLGADFRVLRAMRMRLSRDPRGVLRDFASLCAAGEASASEFEARYLEQSAEMPKAALEGGLAFLSQTDLRGALEEKAVAALWIHGERDAVIPLASARAAAALSPGSKLEVLAGRGHALPWTAAREVAQLVRALLEERDAPLPKDPGRRSP